MSTLPSAPAVKDKSTKRLKISLTATLAIGIGILVAMSTGAVLLITAGASARNTFSLLEERALLGLDLAEVRLRGHLDPVADQMGHLGALSEEGLLDLGNLPEAGRMIAGALAATPQVIGIAFWQTEDPTNFRVVPRFLFDEVFGELEDGLFLQQGDQDVPGVVALDQINRDLPGTYWSDLVWIDDIDAPGLSVRQSLRRDGEHLGGAAAAVTVLELSRFVETLDIGVDGNQAFLLYGSDNVLAHPAFAEIDGPVGTRTPDGGAELPLLTEVGDPVLSEIAERRSTSNPLGEPGSRLLEVSLTGSGDPDFIVLLRAIFEYTPQPLILGVALPIESVDDEVTRLVIAATVSLFLAVIAVLLGMYMGRRLVRPIRRFAAYSDAVANMEIEGLAELPESRFKEVSAQARAFNSMLEALRWFNLYVPKSLVRRLMEQESRAGISRSRERDVTVMFTDIEGFTAAAEGLDAGRIGEWLNRHFALVAGAVEAEGGTLDKYIGDGAMAFWGAPDDHPDHADRACRAALTLAEAVAADNDALEAMGLPAIRLRVGLHTGRVLVGNIGAPDRLNYTIVGDAVNIGNRLEALGRNFSGAAPVTILVSDHVLASVSEETRASLSVEDLGEHELRGRIGALRVFRLR